jgi:hypothetical protein
MKKYILRALFIFSLPIIITMALIYLLFEGIGILFGFIADNILLCFSNIEEYISSKFENI